MLLSADDVLFATCPAGTRVPDHVHDTDNDGVVTRGAIFLTLNGEETRVSIGK